MHKSILGDRDASFYERANFLRLMKRGYDSAGDGGRLRQAGVHTLVIVGVSFGKNQRGRETTQQGALMLWVAPQFPTLLSMSHVTIAVIKYCKLNMYCYVLRNE